MVDDEALGGSFDAQRALQNDVPQRKFRIASDVAETLIGYDGVVNRPLLHALALMRKAGHDVYLLSSHPDGNQARALYREAQDIGGADVPGIGPFQFFMPFTKDAIDIYGEHPFDLVIDDDFEPWCERFHYAHPRSEVLGKFIAAVIEDPEQDFYQLYMDVFNSDSPSLDLEDGPV